MGRTRDTGDAEAAEDAALQLLKTRGLTAAANALISVCEDPNATAQAKATAGRTICEVTGMLKKAARDREPDDQPPATLEQIRDGIAASERLLVELQRTSTAADGDDQEDDDADPDQADVLS